MELNQIKEIAKNNDNDTAIKELERYITTHEHDDEAHYILGRLHWQRGEHADAVSCYRKAIAHNPDSPAKHALEIANSVFNFYNPDLLNP